MLNNFHKTMIKCWCRISGTQKGSQFSWKGGRTKYKRQKKKRERERDKRLRDQDLSWGASREGGDHPVGNPPTGGSVGSFGISEGNIMRRKKTKTETKKPTEYMHNHNCQQRSSPASRIHHQQAGLGGRCMLHHWSLG